MLPRRDNIAKKWIFSASGRCLLKNRPQYLAVSRKITPYQSPTILSGAHQKKEGNWEARVEEPTKISCQKEILSPKPTQKQNHRVKGLFERKNTSPRARLTRIRRLRNPTRSTDPILVTKICFHKPTVFSPTRHNHFPKRDWFIFLKGPMPSPPSCLALQALEHSRRGDLLLSRYQTKGSLFEDVQFDTFSNNSGTSKQRHEILGKFERSNLMIVWPPKDKYLASTELTSFPSFQQQETTRPSKQLQGIIASPNM